MKKLRVLNLLIVAAVVFAGLATPVSSNVWHNFTSRNFFVPAESTMATFRVTQMDPAAGSGRWLYAEDGSNYYTTEFAHGEKSYRVLPKEQAEQCEGFVKTEVRTWCW